MNWRLVFLLGVSAIALSGCGGGSSTPPPPPAISVTFSATPPTSLAMGGTAQITASVSNDSAGKGVNWSCTPANTCGTFNPTSTPSGTATTYTAPAAVPAGGKANVVATSVSDSTKSIGGQIHITGIQITFTTAPPSIVPQGTTASPVATVTNDAANTGVSWSCAPAGTCGTFNPTTTPSGTATTYTPPTAGGNVTITAASVTDPAISVTSGTVLVPGGASTATLKGQYAFLIRANVGNQGQQPGGLNGRGNSTFIGSVNLDGNGNLMQLATNCVDPTTGAAVACAGIEEAVGTLYTTDRRDPILPTVPANMPNTSHYTVDANGHGTMRLVTQLSETLDLSFVVTSKSHAEIIEAGGDPGFGTLDLQTPAAGGFNASQISGSYAFTFDGVDTAPTPTHKLSLGGVFQANGTSITSGTLDRNDTNGGTTLGASFTGLLLTAPDQNGRGQLTFSLTSGATLVFTFYIVNNKVLRMFEDDGIDFTGGSAYAQAGTPAQTGTFVYQHSGWSSAGRTVAAGQFTVATAPSISTGVSDSNAGGAAPTTANTAKLTSGSYMPAATPTTLTLTDAAGTSTFNVYPVDPTLNILDPNNTSGGGGALLLHTDASIIGTGILLPQQGLSSPANITGSNAIILANEIDTSSAATSREVAFAGVFLSDGVSNFTNAVADYDADDQGGTSIPMLQAPFTGMYKNDATFAGRFTGTLNIPTPSGGYPFILPSTNSFSVSIYQASPKQSLVLQTDTTASSFGRIVQQQLP